MKVWFNGNLVDRRDAQVDVFDHGLLYGDGVFEGIRIYGGKIFRCDDHLARLRASAEIIRLEIPYSQDEIRDAMHAALQANEIIDGYIRLLVTRGAGDLGLNPFLCEKQNVYIIADRIALYPPEMYERGISVIIAKTVRTSAKMLDPAAKSLNYLNNILAKIESLDAGVSEALMLNDAGNLCEAAADNIFIVTGGVLITPPAEAGMLMGITRGLVIMLARRLGITVEEKDIIPQDLFNSDECFLTGTGAEIIAVTNVDGKSVGGGKPGSITKKLRNAFHEFTKSDEA